MDDVQFENWKQTIAETLARITVLQELAAEEAVARHKEWEARHKEWEARQKEWEARHKEWEARHAESDARHEASEARHEEWWTRAEAADRRMDRFEQNLVRLAVLGRRARSGLNRRQQEHETNMARVELNLAEITDKLNGLIGYVHGQNPQQL